jgi:tripartite-type tricarboxylate transporter receptor subunit TctC
MRRRAFAFGAAAICGLPGLASGFPDRAIVIVDPATPGSSTDIFSRALAEEMSKVLGQVVMVENKPGAAGALAAEFVARAKPDGHTLGLAAVSTHAANPALNKNLRYDPVKDFEPITNMVTLPSATVVNASSPYLTLTDLIDAARRHPGSVSVATPGVGSAGHILLEQFSYLAAVRFLHVPYRGSVQMFTDLLGGHLDVVNDNIPALLPHIGSGKLRALAVRDVKRAPQLPQVPVYAELGFAPVSFPLWFGLVAPHGTPDAIVMQLNEVAHQAMRAEAFQRRVDAGGATYAPSTPSQFREQIQQWAERFRSIVEMAGIKPE